MWPLPPLKPAKKPEQGDQDEGKSTGTKRDGDPHLPSTRALELNSSALRCMLAIYTYDFIDVGSLEKEVEGMFMVLVGLHVVIRGLISI